MRSPVAFALAASALAALAFAPDALAQSVYIDLGPTGVHGAPSTPLAAAAGISGAWNELDTGTISAGPFPFQTGNLVDIAGATSNVRLIFFDLGTGFEGFSYDDPNTSGGDDALLDDLGYFNGGAIVAIRGLAPGNYELYTYASVPDGQAHSTRVTVPSSSDPAQDVTGGFASGYQLGATHALHRITAAAGVDVTVRFDVVNGFMSLNGFQILAEGATGELGTTYCSPAALNSAGLTGVIGANGSRRVADNDVTLRASDLPPSTFGYFLTSRTQGFSMPVNSIGSLCLSGSIGRYRGAGQILNTGTTGAFSLQIDLTQTPTPLGLVTIAPGETWHYQCWFRDSILFIPTSNFTDGRSIIFQ
jgi:hypothetical protein